MFVFKITMKYFQVLVASGLSLSLEFFITSIFFLGVFWEGDNVPKSKSDYNTVTAVASGSKPTAYKGEITLPGLR